MRVRINIDFELLVDEEDYQDAVKTIRKSIRDLTERFHRGSLPYEVHVNTTERF